MPLFRKKLNPLLAKRNIVGNKLSSAENSVARLSGLTFFYGDAQGQFIPSVRSGLMETHGKKKIVQVEKVGNQIRQFDALDSKVVAEKANRARGIIGKVRVAGALASAGVSKHPIRNISRVRRVIKFKKK